MEARKARESHKPNHQSEAREPHEPREPGARAQSTWEGGGGVVAKGVFVPRIVITGAEPSPKQFPADP